MRGMVGHHVVLLMMILVGAVTSDDVTYTCNDVTPVTNFSTAQLTGTWAVISLFRFKDGQAIKPSSEEYQRLYNSEFVCQNFYKVNATNDSIEIVFPNIGVTYLFDAEQERQGYFVDRADAMRKMIVLGAEPGKYFSFVVCEANSEGSVLLLSRPGGLPKEEVSLIARRVEQNLAFNSSIFTISNKTCWDNPAFLIDSENVPTFNCSTLTPHHNVSSNDMSGDWAIVSTIPFTNGKPIISKALRPTWCFYWRGSHVTDDGLSMSVIASRNGNYGRSIETIELTSEVSGLFRKRSENDVDFEMTVVEIDPDEFLALVTCGLSTEDGQQKVTSIKILSRYGNNNVISEDKLVQVETRLLDQLNLNQSYVMPVRYKQNCYTRRVHRLDDLDY